MVPLSPMVLKLLFFFVLKCGCIWEGRMLHLISKQEGAMRVLEVVIYGMPTSSFIDLRFVDAISE